MCSFVGFEGQGTWVEIFFYPPSQLYGRDLNLDHVTSFIFHLAEI